MPIKRSLILLIFVLLNAFTLMASTFVVVNTNDNGAGSLRSAISSSNTVLGLDTILFNISENGVQTITLSTGLPSITSPVFIDAASQNVFRNVDLNQKLITLDGMEVIGHGLTLVLGSENSVIHQVSFTKFVGAGIILDNTSNVEVLTCLFDDNEVGIFINNATQNKIGDGTAQGSNTIVNSKTDGVIIVGNSQYNDIYRNSIYNNTNLGIDLGDNIYDSRDQGDLDTGPNGFQNRPLIDSISIMGGTITFYFTHIGATTTIRFDFYSNDTRDTLKAGGEKWIGAKLVAVKDGDTFNRTFSFDTAHRTFSMLATDGYNTSEFSNLMIKPGLNAPVAVNDTFLINEDVTSIFNVLSNDIDKDNNLDSNSLQIVTPFPKHGLAEVVGNEIQYTPTKDYFGVDEIFYSVCDLTDRDPFCDIAEVFIEIAPTMDKPVAFPDFDTTTQAGVLIIYAAGNDTDSDFNLDESSIRILSSVSNAVITPNMLKNGEIKIDYSQIPSFNSNDTITYSICDSTGLCDTGFVYIFITPGEAPVTKSDFLLTLEDQTKTIDILANDTDPENNIDGQSVSIVKNANNGLATYNPNLELMTYIPNENFNGKDTVIYQVCDATLNCTKDTVFIEVTSQNDAPKAVRLTASTFQGTCVPTFLVDVLQWVNEPDENDSLDFSSFEITSTISGANANSDTKGKVALNYSGVSSFFGKDSLRYKVCDTQGLCDSSYLVIDVLYNSVPTAEDDKLTLIQGSDSIIDLLKNDFDNNIVLDKATFEIISPFTKGTIVNLSNGNLKIDFSAIPTFSGVDELMYKICDLGCFCDSAKLTVTVLDTTTTMPDKMVLNDDLFVFEAGCVITQFNVLENDDLKGKANLASLTLLPFPDKFLWDLSKTGVLTASYYPDTVGVQNFTIKYRLCDTLSRCDTAVINVEVIDNEPPKATTIYYTLEEGSSTSFEINVIESIEDKDGIDFSSLSIIKQPVYGTSIINANGDLKLNLGGVTDFLGGDTVIFKVCDLLCNCSQDSLIVQFKEQNKLLAYDGFSPNGDGKNDVWEIQNIELYPNARVQIFSRWGSLLFESSELNNELGIWDGESVPDGVYYYTLRLYNEADDVITGTILLSR